MENIANFIERTKLADESTIAEVRRINAESPDKYREHEDDDAAQGRNPIGGPSNGMKAALHLLLGMLEGMHYQISSAIVGQYFGYRRSANHGDIIRFYIEVLLDVKSGLLRFKNRYHRGSDRWLVEGPGFDVGEITYLLGHAKSTTSAKGHGFGLRFFSLKKYRLFDWFVGPLITLDGTQDPIAARVVLVPVEQHKSMMGLTDDSREAKLLSLIEERISPEKLDEEIDVSEVGGDKVPPSIHIQALILNASFTALHARPGTIDAEMQDQFKALFAFQQRAIDVARFTQNDFAPFIRIAAHAEQIIPIDFRLADYVRSSENN